MHLLPCPTTSTSPQAWTVQKTSHSSKLLWRRTSQSTFKMLAARCKTSSLEMTRYPCRRAMLGTIKFKTSPTITIWCWKISSAEKVTPGTSQRTLVVAMALVVQLRRAAYSSRLWSHPSISQRTRLRTWLRLDYWLGITITVRATWRLMASMIPSIAIVLERMHDKMLLERKKSDLNHPLSMRVWSSAALTASMSLTPTWIHVSSHRAQITTPWWISSQPSIR